MQVKSTTLALLYAASSVSAAALGGKMAYAAEKTVKEDADFGLCIPTMKFEGGLGGRAASDFTFLPTDPLCARGQQEALNPSKPTSHRAGILNADQGQTSSQTESVINSAQHAAPMKPRRTCAETPKPRFEPWVLATSQRPTPGIRCSALAVP